MNFIRHLFVSARRRGRPAAGFTLVELLVVMAIIGVLVALLLPAIQSAREAARRAQCAQHVSQLILAVHNYEMAHGYFPPGTIDAKGPIVNAPAGYHHNWIIQILPYLELQTTWNALDKSLSVYDPKNAKVAAHLPRILTCPSGNRINNSYAGVHHDVEKPIDEADHGVFFLNSRLKYEDASDGSSNTLFVGEKLPDAWDLHWLSGTRNTLRNTGSAINSSTYGNGLPQPTIHWQILELPAGGDGDSADASAHDPFATFRAAASTAPATGLGSPLYVGGFASHHPQGAHFAYGDGRVQFMTQSMSLKVLQQLAHRSDGAITQSY